MIIDCPACNPDWFIVYGICGMCGRKYYPPLFDPNDKNADFSSHINLIDNWIEDDYRRSE